MRKGSYLLVRPETEPSAPDPNLLMLAIVTREAVVLGHLGNGCFVTSG